MQARPTSLNESRANVNKHKPKARQVKKVNASKAKNKVQQNTNVGKNAKWKGDDSSQLELSKKRGLLNADLNMPEKAVHSTTTS